jgi:hypothetical protein
MEEKNNENGVFNWNYYFGGYPSDTPFFIAVQKLGMFRMPRMRKGVRDKFQG